MPSPYVITNAFAPFHLLIPLTDGAGGGGTMLSAIVPSNLRKNTVPFRFPTAMSESLTTGAVQGPPVMGRMNNCDARLSGVVVLTEFARTLPPPPVPSASTVIRSGIPSPLRSATAGENQKPRVCAVDTSTTPEARNGTTWPVESAGRRYSFPPTGGGSTSPAVLYCGSG